MFAPLILSLALLQNPAPLPPYVVLPPTVQIDPTKHALTKITVSTNCTQVKWLLASDTGDLIVSETGLWAIFGAPPGKYLVIAWGASGGVPTDAAQCWVTVGTPAPPTPPGPVPPPIPAPPNDQWWLALKAAFMTETPADKALIGKVAQVYQSAAGVISTATDTTIKGFVDRAMTPLMAAQVGQSLIATRTAIGKALAGALPTEVNAPLDAAARAQCATAFARIAVCCNALAAGS